MNEDILECKLNKGIEGIIKLSGSKNASLPIIISCLLCKDKSIIHNVPSISDVNNLLVIFDKLNVRSTFKDNDLIIDSSSLEYIDLTMEEVKRIRASYYLIPVLLYFNDEVKITSIGGCSFENRPIDIHLDLLSSFGVKCDKLDLYYYFKKDKLKSIDYTFRKKSVGATINALLLASQIEGTTILRNYSLEIEVFEVIDTLILMGVSINYDKDKIVINGVKKFRSIEKTIIEDRIEGETFIIFALTYGRMILVNINKKYHRPFISFLDSIDAKYEFGNEVAYFQKRIINKSLVLTFGNEDFISTDISSLLIIYLLLNNKKMSLFSDIIYKKRISFMEEFSECAVIKNDKLIINPRNLDKDKHCYLKGKSLRETMALILYSFCNEKRKFVEGKKYLFRGYEDIVNKLISINGEVKEYEI